ncbi:MAG: HipA N-terminal domain-containing protein [Lentisphaeria bacterium]|nr:HipA N-terminal domain-containing protein [Lentisphaeria bacterium]
MRRGRVFMHGLPAGILVEEKTNQRYQFDYDPEYTGPPVSRTMPRANSPYVFDSFPTFFDGLLPEGMMLEALLRKRKIDRDDLFAQLLAVGGDLVGAVTVVEETSI